MRKLLIFGFVLMQLCPVFADDIKTIHVVCDEWEGYTNKDGTGAYWEVVKAVYEPLGIKVKTMVMPWKRAEMTVANKMADALLGAYYYKYKEGKEYLYPKWHISIEDPVIAVFKKGTIKDWESKGIKSLAGKRVVWIRGYDFDKTLLNGIRVKKHEINRHIQGLSMVDRGRMDVFLDYKYDTAPVAKKNGIDLDKHFEIKLAKLGDKLFVAFAITERSEKLIKIFDERITKLANSGKIAKIYLKWGQSEKKFGKERFGKD
ncbi:MAG: transporter substrate-binding domain-containing protein [Desulfobacula sp.]|nr:transporter substrate-binding domain-containing protein [Desulfobacula sp.]